MLCVYGVVSAVAAEALDLTRRGVHGGTVKVVDVGPVAAVASLLDGELLARRRDVEAHLDVVESAFSTGTVLPFRFGTVAEDEAGLRRFLAANEQRYLQLLEELDGLVQMTVKAVRSDDDTIRVVVGADDRLRRVVRRLQGSAAIADQIQLGEQVASAVQVLSQRDAHDIASRVSGVARRVVADEVTAPTILSLAVLLHADEIGGLDRVVAHLLDDYGNRIAIDYAGPMPPYSFVS